MNKYSKKGNEGHTLHPTTASKHLILLKQKLHTGSSRHLELRQQFVSCTVLHLVRTSRLGHQQNVVNVHLTSTSSQHPFDINNNRVLLTDGWQLGVTVRVVGHINEIVVRQAQLVPEWVPLPSNRQYLSCDACLEVKREDNQNCSVLCCV